MSISIGIVASHQHNVISLLRLVPGVIMSSEIGCMSIPVVQMIHCMRYGCPCMGVISSALFPFSKGAFGVYCFLTKPTFCTHTFVLAGDPTSIYTYLCEIGDGLFVFRTPSRSFRFPFRRNIRAGQSQHTSGEEKPENPSGDLLTRETQVGTAISMQTIM